jgi:hypothetical protein
MTSKAALLQLIAKSEINNYLNTNDIKNSLFKNQIKPVTNFSESSFSIYPENSGSWGDTITFKISKYGDLLTNIYLVLELPELSVEDIDGLNENIRSSQYRIRWNEYIGNVLINKVILRIGGKKIDEQTGEFLQFFTDIYDKTWSKICMLGNDRSMILPNTKINKQYIYIPLKFFFNIDISKSLPIYALYNHEIEIEIQLNSWDNCYFVLHEVTNEISDTENKTSKIHFAHTDKVIIKKNFSNIRLDCNYIFLDNNERKYILENEHKILITQVQYLENNINNNCQIKMDFNNPIKEFFFAIQKNENRILNEVFNFSGKSQYLPINTTTFTERLWEQIPKTHLLKEAALYFDHNERIPYKDYKYWHYVQNYEHYRNTLEHNIYMYSFGILPRDNMGSCNFSELENVYLNIKLENSSTEYIHYTDNNTIAIGPENNTIIKIYAINYNIFNIDSGISRLMFPY